MHKIQLFLEGEKTLKLTSQEITFMNLFSVIFKMPEDFLAGRKSRDCDTSDTSRLITAGETSGRNRLKVPDTCNKLFFCHL